LTFDSKEDRKDDSVMIMIDKLEQHRRKLQIFKTEVIKITKRSSRCPKISNLQMEKMEKLLQGF
jgi:hypothetical protein